MDEVRGKSSIAGILAEIEKLEEFERAEREVEAVRRYLLALLPRPSHHGRLRRWLGDLLVRAGEAIR